MSLSAADRTYLNALISFAVVGYTSLAASKKGGQMISTLFSPQRK